FGVGDNNTTITTIDPDGIALAAVKALYRKQLELDARTAEIDDLKIELTEMRELLQKLAEKE
ncbi:MAG TPA: peptidase S74, partial [candidate division Zixibacteria bacterium]|nr:peptidase S74 [candidate division Zixibacteria bacterium]